MHANSSSPHGFTLIELLITITMAAVLLGIAIPSFSTTIKDNRLTAAVNEMITSLNLARGEAIRRGIRVTVCKSSDGNLCTTSDSWTQGWIIFTDPSNPATATNPVFDSTTETKLKVSSAKTSLKIAGNNDVVNYVSYVPSGQNLKINGANITGTIAFCDDRKGAFGKNIVLSNTGRARIDKGKVCN